MSPFNASYQELTRHSRCPQGEDLQEQPGIWLSLALAALCPKGDGQACF